MAARKRPTVDVETRVLVLSKRRCCLCYCWEEHKGRRRGQIAHINRKRNDSRFDNLVWLCAEHHDEYDSRTSQSKGITSGELREYRNRLYKEINSKLTILTVDESVEGLSSEPSSNEKKSEYDRVYERFEGELKYVSSPWRFPLWQVANQPELFAYKAGNRADGICLIERIDLPDGRVVVICIQVPGNPGNSITNCVEELCFQVCQRFEIDASRLVWLENYDHGSLPMPDEWDLVTFSRCPPDRPFEGPAWTTMTSPMWQSLRLRPKKRLSTRYGRFESKVRKLFHWPTENIF
jgi:hypothetical protein